MRSFLKVGGAGAAKNKAMENMTLGEAARLAYSGYGCAFPRKRARILSDFRARVENCGDGDALFEIYMEMYELFKCGGDPAAGAVSQILGRHMYLGSDPRVVESEVAGLGRLILPAVNY